MRQINVLQLYEENTKYPFKSTSKSKLLRILSKMFV